MSEIIFNHLQPSTRSDDRAGGGGMPNNVASSHVDTFSLAYRRARSKLLLEIGSRNMLPFWQDEEDYLQEAALKIWGRLLEGSLSLHSDDYCFNLLQRISKHAGIDAWRKETRSGKVNFETLGGSGLGSNVNAQDFHHKIVLSETLSTLSSDERFLLFARAVFKMNWEEISVSLGITPQAARTRFCRLRRRISGRLQSK